MSAAAPPDETEAFRVVIVGGGVAGLAAAWELESSTPPGAVPIDLFEATERLGGPLITDRASGHILEGGPDSFLTSKPEALDLCEELGLSGSVIGVRPAARRAFIYRRGRCHRIPLVLGAGRWASARSVLAASVLSPLGRLRLLLGGSLVGLRPLPSGDEVALGPELRSRFGNEAVDWLLEPLIAGVHPAPVDRLSASAVANVLPSRWRTAEKDPPRPAPSRVAPGGSATPRPADPGAFATLREGMDLLPRRLVERLRRTRLHVTRRVAAVRRNASGWEVDLEAGGSVPADGIVLAVPAASAARLLRSASPEAAAALGAVRASRSIVVGLVFDRSQVPASPEGSGVLVPFRAGLPISAVTWLSSKWDRPPAEGDSVGVRVFLRNELSAREPPPSELEAVSWAREGLRAVAGIVGEPRYAAVFVHPPALPWYEVGHGRRIATARSALGPRVQLAGASYDGIGIPDSIRSGRTAARAMLRSNPRLPTASSARWSASAVGRPSDPTRPPGGAIAPNPRTG